MLRRPLKRLFRSSSWKCSYPSPPATSTQKGFRSFFQKRFLFVRIFFLYSAFHVFHLLFPGNLTTCKARYLFQRFFAWRKTKNTESVGTKMHVCSVDSAWLARLLYIVYGKWSFSLSLSLSRPHTRKHTHITHTNTHNTDANTLTSTSTYTHVHTHIIDTHGHTQKHITPMHAPTHPHTRAHPHSHSHTHMTQTHMHSRTKSFYSTALLSRKSRTRNKRPFFA